ncbi:MAG: TVP38/TMEM64 family protein, partial [Pseudomonadota bacterium]
KKDPDQSGKGTWKLLAAIAFLCVPVSLFVIFDLHHYLSFEALREHNQQLQALVARWPIIAMGVYCLCYAIATGLSLPAGALLTLLGGYIFGAFLGTTLTVIGATAGAMLIFIVARIAGDTLAHKCPSSMLDSMRSGVQENAFYYILTLRLIPVFPFWAVNIAPALLGVRLLPYSIATALGIIPGSFVFSLAGQGLENLLAEGENLDLKQILTGDIALAMAGLAILSLLPPGIKIIKKRRAAKSQNKN